MTVPLACLATVVVAVAAAGVHPKNVADWLLESLLTFVAVPLAVVGSRRFRFSNRAYVQATLFVLLHTLGSHYTYSEVPLGFWAQDAFGWSRNHYDRAVHFLFGLLMLRPIRELGFRGTPHVGRFAQLYFCVAASASWSLAYEVLEWLVARTVDPGAGTAFLGTQGDPWDTQSDMFMALIGSSLAVTMLARWHDRSMARLG